MISVLVVILILLELTWVFGHSWYRKQVKFFKGWKGLTEGVQQELVFKAFVMMAFTILLMMPFIFLSYFIPVWVALYGGAEASVWGWALVGLRVFAMIFAQVRPKFLNERANEVVGSVWTYLDSAITLGILYMISQTVR